MTPKTMQIVSGYKKKPFAFRDKLINHTIGLDTLVFRQQKEVLRYKYNLLSTEISLLQELYDALTKYHRYSKEQKRVFMRLRAKKEEMESFKQEIERFKALRVND